MYINAENEIYGKCVIPIYVHYFNTYQSTTIAFNYITAPRTPSSCAVIELMGPDKPAWRAP